jgi:phospholipid transport system substrate-binding protein
MMPRYRPLKDHAMLDRRSLLTGLTAAFLLLPIATPAWAQGGMEADAKRFIGGLADRAIQSLIKADVPRQQRVEKFRQLFNDAFAVRSIGKWVLGRAWNDATEAEQEEYLDLFEDLMIYSYVDRFATYTGDAITVAEAVREDDTYATVQTIIPRPGGEKPIDVRWRVGRVNGGYKIADVVVEGVSMSTTLRSQFASIIRRNGGQVAGLIAELRQKTKELGRPA